MNNFDLKNVLKNIPRDTNGNVLPQHFRFYRPDLAGFCKVVDAWYDSSASNTATVNPAVLPNRIWYRIVFLNFLRTYALTIHHDIYKLAGLVDDSFTPRKGQSLLEQRTPSTIVDAVRELARPLVMPDGNLLYPDRYTAIDEILEAETSQLLSQPVKNGINAQSPDAYLRDNFKIYFRPALAGFLTSSVGGQTFIEGLSREGLEPARFFVEVRQHADFDQLGQAPTALMPAYQVNRPRLVNGRLLWQDDEEQKKYTDADVPAYCSSIRDAPITRYSTVHTVDLWHNEDQSSERYFAISILRHVSARLVGANLRRPLNEQTIPDIFPPEFQFLGCDPLRVSYYPVSIFEIRRTLFDFLRVNPEYDTQDYNINRWVTLFDENLQDWNFPSLGKIALAAQSSFPKDAVQRPRPRRRGKVTQRAAYPADATRKPDA